MRTRGVIESQHEQIERMRGTIDALRAERDQLNEIYANALGVVVALRARVAELEAGLRSITAADPSETQLEAYVHWVHDTVRGLLQKEREMVNLERMREINAAGGIRASHAEGMLNEIAALRAERDEQKRNAVDLFDECRRRGDTIEALRARVAELEAARQADEADAKRLGNENQRLRANLAQLWVRLGAIHGDAEKMLAGADPSAGGG